MVYAHHLLIGLAMMQIVWLVAPKEAGATRLTLSTGVIIGAHHYKHVVSNVSYTIRHVRVIDEFNLSRVHWGTLDWSQCAC